MNRGKLTPSELKVVRGIVQGLSNGAIAQRLHLSRVTVNSHCVNMYRKLGIRNRCSLLGWYYRMNPEQLMEDLSS